MNGAQLWEERSKMEECELCELYMNSVVLPQNFYHIKDIFHSIKIIYSFWINGKDFSYIKGMLRFSFKSCGI